MIELLNNIINEPGDDGLILVTRWSDIIDLEAAWVTRMAESVESKLLEWIKNKSRQLKPYIHHHIKTIYSSSYGNV